MNVFLEWLPDWTLRVSVVLAFASAVCMILRRKSAALRHVIWAAAFVVALLTPLLKPIGFRITRPAVVRLTEAPELPLPGPVANTSVVNTGTPSQPAPPWRIPILPGVWALGTLVFALRALNGVRQARRLRLNATEFDRAAVELVGERAGLPLKLFSGVALAESGRVVVPMTLGLRSPLILLPADWRDWCASRLRAVLLHELAHVRRRDSLVQWLPQVVCILHWFNPLAWFAKSQMLCESERACDDAVVRTGASGSDFARDLVEIAQSIQRKGAYPMTLALTTKLERRISRLLDVSADRRPLTAGRTILAAFAVVALLAPLAGIHAQEAAPVATRVVPASAVSAVAAPILTPPLLAQVRQAVPRQPAEPANAQETVTLSGVVSDPSGAVIVGAMVRAYGPQGNPQTTATGATGQWSLMNLRPGFYAIEILAPGFARADNHLQLAAGQTASMNVRLEVGRMAESLTITAPGTPRPAAAAVPNKPQRIRVGGNVQAGRLLQRTDPVYPESARLQGVEGTVKLAAVIDKYGNVLSAQVTNSDAAPELADAALAAIRTWQYQPTLLNGEPVEVLTEIALNFQLR